MQQEGMGEDPGQYGLQDLVPKWQEVNFPKANLPPLRRHQTAAMQAWRTAGHQGIVALPTAAGKTIMALSLMAEAACSTLVIVPLLALMHQWSDLIRQYLGYDPGMIGDRQYWYRPICVTTYDSACIRMERLGAMFKLIVFDECHHLPGRVRGDAARLSAAPWRLGLTATPDRSDGRDQEIVTLIGPICYRLAVADLEGDTLATFDVQKLPVDLTELERERYDELGILIREFVAERRHDNPDFEWSDLHAEGAKDARARAVARAHRERQAIEDGAAAKLEMVEFLLGKHHRTPTLIFTGSNRAARAVALRFLIPCLLADCGPAERKDILDGLREGRYHAVVANQIFDEGLDFPSAKVAIVLGGKTSTRQAVQRLGRILRPARGHPAILYEVVCRNTGEVQRSNARHQTDAYARSRSLRVRPGQG
jgi:superfamily II DNA or RNA helicase